MSRKSVGLPSGPKEETLVGVVTSVGGVVMPSRDQNRGSSTQVDIITACQVKCGYSQPILFNIFELEAGYISMCVDSYI